MALGSVVVAPPTAGAAPPEALERVAPAGGPSSPEGEVPGRAAFEGGTFQLRPGEVVVFTGGTNLVREQVSGELEARLAAALANLAPRFRPMAWEGDTVYEQRRELNFGTWPEQLRAVRAGAVVAQFGQMESLDGTTRLPEFVAAYSRLLDRFAERTGRLVLISPMPFEKPLAPGAPDLRRRNRDARAYAGAVASIARRRGAVFVDLFATIESRPKGTPRLTDNGIHLNAEGLRAVGAMVAAQLAGKDAARVPPAALRAAVVEKNRLWFDSWRPMNWAFAYGDRTSQRFGQPAGGHPWLKEELGQLRALVAAEEARIHALARGEEPGRDHGPAEDPAPPPPLPGADDPLSPLAEALAALEPAEGYAVNCFASEAEGVVNPIQFAWDERGRLYIACSPTYPHVVPGQRPADYILVCEDSDGDGRAERSWRFAEGLHMVQGLEPGAGGLYVCAGTELLHFKDADRDGRADPGPGSRRVVLSGFGTGDAHQLINSVSHGPAGALWLTQGLHINSAVETPWGIARLEKSGVWRFRPSTGRLEGFFNGGRAGHNCWGVAFDDDLQPFHKTGDRPHGYYLLPGLMSIDDPHEYHPRGSLFQARAKTNALDFIGTRHLPDEVQGHAVLGGFMGGTVDRYAVLDDGAGFRSEQQADLLRSKSPDFRPVDVGVGPDGAVYVCDFHNRLIGHYQTSYRDPGRDHRHGRIWRVTAVGRPPARPPDLPALGPAGWLRQLTSPERWVRYQAKRLLFDAPAEEVIPAADAWVASIGAADPARGRLLLEVVGVYRAHRAARPGLAAELATSADPTLRAYGARLAGAWAGDPGLRGVGQGQGHALLFDLAGDPHPRVRLEALVAAVGGLPPRRALGVMGRVFAAPREDRFIDYALINAARALRPAWQGQRRQDREPGAEAEAEADPAPGRDLLAFLVQHGGTAATIQRGQALYESLCLNCHQPAGEGLPGIYPPLAGSDRLGGEFEPLVRILLHGLAGPLEASGKPYQGFMPPAGLSDGDVAAVLNYTRRRFSGEALPEVSPADVARVRAAAGERDRPWSAAEVFAEPQ